MKPTTLTEHAKRRIAERCSLSQAQIVDLLDAQAGIAIHLQKGGRLVHRLIYSTQDEDWFMVVQDGGNREVLTVIPLKYLDGRSQVTASHKRQARRKALDVQATVLGRAQAAAVETPKPPFTTDANGRNWRIRLLYRLAGRVEFRMLAWVPVEFGSPTDWLEAGPIHIWLKHRLAEAEIPIASVESVLAVGRKQVVIPVDDILAHLPMSEDEIQRCRFSRSDSGETA